MQYLALLRALGMVVDSHGVSHAQIERLLCDRIVAGRRAEQTLLTDPAAPDQDRLRQLVAGKVAVEESGLARADGRRDRAGGQRIGELLSGKFPRNAMPSRRRVEVCVDAFLQILEDKDPLGYAEGRYGTRELWFELWLEADQGSVPKLGRRARTVAGYLDAAVQQLSTLHAQDGPAELLTPQTDGAVGRLPRSPAVEQQLAEVRAEAEARLNAQREAHALELALARAETDQAVARAEALTRRQRPPRWIGSGMDRWWRLSTAVLAATTAGLIVALSQGGPASRVVMTFQPYALNPGPPGVTIPLNLPTDRETGWALTLQLRLDSTTVADACVHDSQLTYTLRNHTKVVSTGALSRGLGKITTGSLPLGDIGDRPELRLSLTVTVGKYDAGCQFTLDPSGTFADPVDHS